MRSSAQLSQAVGKLITGKVVGLELDDATEELIRDGTMSGVTLFKYNAADLRQLIVLVERLHQVGGPDFLITVDQEGGAVQRFDQVLTALPSAMALSAQGQVESVTELMAMSARQLRLLGVNCCLAPVLDINSNPKNPIIGTRSFGANRQRVVDLGLAVARAYLSEGVLPVAKHYPGHGDTFEDTHLQMAAVDVAADVLAERELYPFYQCAPYMPAMLIAHVWLSAFDAKSLPASLSPRVTQQLLRDEFGYDGFLITDDMPVMKAIVDHWGLEEAGVMAINAGVDNLLLSGTVEQIRSVHKALCQAIEDGIISEERLQLALNRRARALACCRNERPESLSQRQALLEKEIEDGNLLAAQVSARAVALARGVVCNPLLQPEKWVLIIPEQPRYALNLGAELALLSSPGAAQLQEVRYSINPGSDEIARIAATVAGRKCLFVTFRALLNGGQLELGRELAATMSEGLLVAADVPYELFEMEVWRNAIATFDPSDLAIKSLALVLSGSVQAKGDISLVTATT